MKSLIFLWMGMALLSGCAGRNFTVPAGDDSMNLFEHPSLWTDETFQYNGEIAWGDSVLTLGRGGYMTGVTWEGPILRNHYQIELKARRVEGIDFFCGLTFPVGDEPCSLILGGWGGFTTGLSNINGLDASENETTGVVMFENNVWYQVRLEVTSTHIRAWVDDELIVEAERAGNRFGIRPEVEPSVPLGLATYNTTGWFRDFRVSALPEPKI